MHSPRSIRRVIQSSVESLEIRRLLSSATFTTIGFNGTNGFAPSAAVQDSAGDIVGVTNFTSVGQNIGNGVVFEIAAGTSKIVDLASFPSISGGGLDQGQSVLLDSAGDIFGTDSNAIFEIVKGTHTLKTLASFTNTITDGRVVSIDSHGNLWGLDGGGSVFELVKGSSTISGQIFGQQSMRGLAMGPDGNLYGYTQYGIIEDSFQTNTATTLASFNSATTGSEPTGITFDSDGNIWGLCSYGGPNGSAPGNGVIWEYEKSSQSLIERAAFTSASGYTPIANPVIFGSNVLYGLTTQGGANGDGTLFSLNISSFVTAAKPAAIKPASAAIIQSQVDYTSGDTPTSNWKMVAATIVYGPLADLVVMADTDTASPNGAVSVETNSKPVIPNHTANDWKKWAKSVDSDMPLANALTQQANSQATSASPVTSKAYHAGRPFIVVSRAASLATIKSQLSKAQADIKSASGEITKGLKLFNAYNTLSATIATLDKQLAGNINTATKNKLKAQIAADQTQQNTDATQEDTYYTSVGSKLTTISSLLSQSKTELKNLPAVTVSFAGSIATVPSVVTPGKKAVAVVTVTNDGNVTTQGALTITLSARPVGTTGAQDVGLPTSSVTIKLTAGASVNESLTFTAPKKLAAGHYVLVAQIDPKKLYKEKSAAAAIVGDQTFRVK